MFDPVAWSERVVPFPASRKIPDWRSREVVRLPEGSVTLSGEVPERSR